MIDGRDAIAACYHLAGRIGGIRVDGLTLRELWLKACGRMEAIREQVVWQAMLVWRMDGINVQDFIRRGDLGRTSGTRVTIRSPKLRAAVDAEIKRMNEERAAKLKA